MLTANPSGLVGLIVIESSDDAEDTAGPGASGDDATLAQILRRLTQGSGTAADADATGRPLQGSRFTRLSAAPNRVHIVTADCRSLGNQLEQAARQLRHKLALAERLAR